MKQLSPALWRALELSRAGFQTHRSNNSSFPNPADKVFSLLRP